MGRLRKPVIFICVIAVALVASAPADSQGLPTISFGSATGIFREAREICRRDQGKLWGHPLCGPIMLVDPLSREIVANQRDRGEILRPTHGYFTGALPASENMANTATPWSGTFWTQIVWPLPDDTKSRSVLIAHEMFHRIAPKLDLPLLRGGDNHHLDTIDGRYLLQLEWRALAAALKATDPAARKRAVEDALTFRAERYRIFPSAAADEAALEINEGLAEYTGVRLGLPDKADRFGAALGEFVLHGNDKTFVRSFAYATGPAYGLLLDRYAPAWRKQLATQPRLDLLLARAAAVQLPQELHDAANGRAQVYDGPDLRAAEIQRDAVRQQVLAAYRKRFIQNPTVVVPLVHMNIQFDPRNLQPLDELGTVYPTARVTDDWGVLEAKNGALLSQKWDRVTLSGPAVISGNVVSAEGWSIELRPGWNAVAGERKGDIVIKGPAI